MENFIFCEVRVFSLVSGIKGLNSNLEASLVGPNN